MVLKMTTATKSASIEEHLFNLPAAASFLATSQALDNSADTLSTAAESFVSIDTDFCLLPTTTTTPQSPVNKTEQHNVTFGQVHVRHYDRTLSYNPACSHGPGVGLDWTFATEESCPIDEYETKRIQQRRPEQQQQQQHTTSDTSSSSLALSWEDRESILIEWGVDYFEIEGSSYCIGVARCERMQTVRQWQREQRTAARKHRRAQFLHRLAASYRSSSSLLNSSNSNSRKSKNNHHNKESRPPRPANKNKCHDGITRTAQSNSAYSQWGL